MSPAACADPILMCGKAGPIAAGAAATASLADTQHQLTRSAVVAETPDPVDGGSRRWHHFVSQLAAEAGPCSAQAVEQTLAAAIDACKSDFQWADSGLVELLKRAHDAARNGFASTARQTALGLLDFANVVQRYKAGVSSGLSDGRRSSGTSSGDEVASATKADDDVEPCAGSKRRRGEADQEGQSDSKAAKSNSSRHRRRGESLATWAGPVRVRGGAEFCRLSMQVPEPVLAGLPRQLEVSSIRQRKDVAGMAGVTCSTCITSAGAQQTAELRKMAQLELVAIVRLEDCGAILVPYLTEAGHLKAVTFLAAME